jgi:hypothetical protein
MAPGYNTGMVMAGPRDKLLALRLLLAVEDQHRSYTADTIGKYSKEQRHRSDIGGYRFR